MPFWSKYTDPPTSMICGFKKEHMLKPYKSSVFSLKTITTMLKSPNYNAFVLELTKEAIVYREQ